MKIGDGPKLPSLPATLEDAAKAAAKSVKELPEAAKTPTTGGSAPVPYPKVGDTFERVETSKRTDRMASLLATEQRIDKERDAAWMSFGTSVVAAGAAFGGGAAGAAAAASGAGSAAQAAAGIVLAAGGVAASSAVAAALVAGAVAGAAAEGVSSGAATVAQGALHAVTEAAVQGGARGVDELFSAAWSRFVNEQAASGGAVDPNALVQAVLRESYLQTTEDLRFYAEKVKHFNEQKGAIREHLQKLRDHDMSAGAPAGGSAEETRQSQAQETMRLFQETVNQASNIHRKFSETAQAIIDNLKA